MSFLSDIVDIFPHTIKARKRTGQDEEGEPTFGAFLEYAAGNTNWPAYCTGGHELVRDATGNQQVATAMCIVAGLPGLGSNDELTLPANFENRTPDIILIERQPDEAGDHHETYYFK